MNKTALFVGTVNTILSVLYISTTPYYGLFASFLIWLGTLIIWRKGIKSYLFRKKEVK